MRSPVLPAALLFLPIAAPSLAQVQTDLGAAATAGTSGVAGSAAAGSSGVSVPPSAVPIAGTLSAAPSTGLSPAASPGALALPSAAAAPALARPAAALDASRAAPARAESAAAPAASPGGGAGARSGIAPPGVGASADAPTSNDEALVPTEARRRLLDRAVATARALQGEAETKAGEPAYKVFPAADSSGSSEPLAPRRRGVIEKIRGWLAPRSGSEARAEAARGVLPSAADADAVFGEAVAAADRRKELSWDIRSEQGVFYRGVSRREFERIVADGGIVPRAFHRDWTGPSFEQALRRDGVAVMMENHTEGYTPYLTSVSKAQEIPRIAAAGGELLRVTVAGRKRAYTTDYVRDKIHPELYEREAELLVPGKIAQEHIEVYDEASQKWRPLPKRAGSR